MLRELLGGFDEALARLAPGVASREDIIEVLAERLRGLPNPASLVPGASVLKRRKTALWQLSALRNAAAHAREDATTAETAEEVWSGVVADPEIGFYRWFPAAFLPPHTAR
ncbi:MAG: hypothetical protein ACJ8AW_14640 [Rhodopila sp.]